MSRKRDRMLAFEQACKARRLAVTVQRRAVFETLLEGMMHVSADDVHQQVQRKVPGLSKTTVYRALDALVEAGVVNKVYQPGAPVLFDPCTHDHHHLACGICGKVVDLSEDAFKTPIVRPGRMQGFEIKDAHVFFRGTCPDCLAKQGGAKKRTGSRPKRKRATSSMRRSAT